MTRFSKHLVLLGAGHAHVHVLQALGKHRLAGVRITVVTPSPRQLYSGMVPGFVAGYYALDECMIGLAGLLARCGADLVQSAAVGLDANARRITLANGVTLHFDWLSVNSGPVMNRAALDAAMPGAARHALFVRPMEAFVQHWFTVMTQAAHQPLHLAVVGAGAAGLELAMAAAVASRAPGMATGATVTLVTGGSLPGQSYPAGVQRRVIKALQRQGVAVRQAACVGMTAHSLALADGEHLACTMRLLAVGAQAPEWLVGSGLALDNKGFMAVNAYQQSTSHPRVFAAGDVASRLDAPHPRSGVYAVRAGPPLLVNLRAALHHQPLTPYFAQARALNLLSCGDQRAIATWGRFYIEGRWVWRLKDLIDRRFVARYTR